jgi:hypothetical protein
MAIPPGLPRLRSSDWACSGDDRGSYWVEERQWRMGNEVVCSMASRERSIYRGEQVVRGSVVVDMGAAIPARCWARQRCGCVLLVQAKL